MTRCIIPGCPNEIVAGGLCPKHYMRQRRRGDPNAEFPRGRPPLPKPGLETLRPDNAQLRERVATLEGQLA
jgi:hypothetical protein